MPAGSVRAHGLADVMMGAAPRDLDSELDGTWQWFFMAVPMISTTFASIGRMLKGVDREAIGGC